MFRVTIWG